jgi:hypothetical protein
MFCFMLFLDYHAFVTLFVSTCLVCLQTVIYICMIDILCYILLFYLFSQAAP